MLCRYFNSPLYVSNKSPYDGRLYRAFLKTSYFPPHHISQLFFSGYVDYAKK
jgi:hypothetical protein